MGRSKSPDSRREFYGRALRTNVVLARTLPHPIWERVFLSRFHDFSAALHGFSVQVAGGTEFLIDDGSITAAFDELAGSTFEDGRSVSRHAWQGLFGGAR